MVSWLISRLVVLFFGILYPAYSSYKAVRTKNVRQYVRWMMYWIVFALFTTVETFTDLMLCWLPFYFELKIAFVIWLLSPYTRGSSVLYRKFVHPMLSSHEQEIDDYLHQAKERSYDAMLHFGKRGINIAATAAVTAASKGQGALTHHLRSFSMQDLHVIPSSEPLPGDRPLTRSPIGHSGMERDMGRHRSGALTDGERSDVISDDDDADDAWEQAVIASSIRRSRLRKMPKSQQRYGSLKRTKVTRKTSLSNITGTL
uniref:receptor expression-enhancing protein 1-like isoform X1 n=1 Tax=Myxine glutinosa TaxID=7769 RepID=UPI00358DFE90